MTNTAYDERPLRIDCSIYSIYSREEEDVERFHNPLVRSVEMIAETYLSDVSSYEDKAKIRQIAAFSNSAKEFWQKLEKIGL